MKEEEEKEKEQDCAATCFFTRRKTESEERRKETIHMSTENYGRVVTRRGHVKRKEIMRGAKRRA